MNVDQAKEFVRRHGIILESARGSVPNIAEEIAGRPIKGSWWGDPKGDAIFVITRALRADPDLLVCRLVDGKVTYVHRRTWPALVRQCSQFATDHLASICEVHTTTGKHEVQEVSFPDWVPNDVQTAATKLSEEKARKELANVLDRSYWYEP